MELIQVLKIIKTIYNVNKDLLYKTVKFYKNNVKMVTKKIYKKSITKL